MSKLIQPLPEWEGTIIEPSALKKTDGWASEEKPPAEWFNWLFNTNYLCLKEIQEKSDLYGVDTGTTNNYAVGLPIETLTEIIGVLIGVVITHTNTGASTLTINSLASKAIFNKGGACVGNEMLIDTPVVLLYDGTRFHIVSSVDNLKVLLTASGDMVFASAPNTPARLAKGIDGQTLRMINGLPVWSNLGVASVSDTILLSADTERSTSSATYVVLKSFKVGNQGLYRITFDAKSDSDYGMYKVEAGGVVIVNDQSISPPSYNTYTVNLTNSILPGDFITISLKKSAGSTSYIRNARIKCTINYYEDTVITD